MQKHILPKKFMGKLSMNPPYFLHYTLLLLLTVLFSFIPVFSQCPTNEAEIRIEINEDNNFVSDNTRWELWEEGQLYENGTSGTNLCVPEDACFILTFFDDFGNGLNNLPPGSYSIYYNNVLVNSGSDFGAEKSIQVGTCTAGTACSHPINLYSAGTFQAPAPNTWYSFVAFQTGIYTLSSCSLGNTCEVAIWGYDICDGLISNETQEEGIFFSESGCSNQQAIVSTHLVANKEYFFRIGDVGTDCLNNSINWRLEYMGPVTGCTDITACNYNPLAAIDDDSCLEPGEENCPNGPDLIVDEASLVNSLYLQSLNNNDNCYINEGCLKGYGAREVLRFDTKISNIGTQDFYVGQVPSSPSESNEQWEWDECHNHWHYEGYAEYLVYDENGQQLPVGFKNGFCVIDLECNAGATPKYSCFNQGITANCSDIYGSHLDCQWVDLTDVPEGYYTLVLRVNWDKTPDALGREETNYENNWTQACFYLDRSGNNPSIDVITDCPTYTDCLGEELGDTQPDCQGICGGHTFTGDLDGNEVYDDADIALYVEGLLDESLTADACNEVSGDGQLSILDPTLLLSCFAHNHQNGTPHSHLNPCTFPSFTIENPYQNVTFSIGAHNPSNQYFDIYITNPLAHISAYNLELEGVTISDVESIVYTNYNAEVYHDGNGEILALSLDGSYTLRYPTPAPFVRVYYSEIEENACISQILGVINHTYEVVGGIIGSNACVNEVAISNTCTENTVSIIVVTDNYGSETSWEVLNTDTEEVLYESSPYENSNIVTEVVNMCLPNGCYEFNIYDSYGDGMCCNYGIGAYSVNAGGNILGEGGEYTFAATVKFCLESSANPSQDDDAVIAPDQGLNLSAKIFLQGALQGSGDPDLMRDDLRSQGLLPTTEPYSALSNFNHGGGESISNSLLSVTGDDAIVDWILLEMRNALNPSIIELTRAVLVQRDGDIVDHNGSSFINFAQLQEGYYYVAFRHRNHLGAMTATSLPLHEGILHIDFTDSSMPTWGNHAQVQMPSGNMALWGGNPDGNSTIIFQGDNNDTTTPFFEVLNAQTGFPMPNFILEGYSMGDIDMNAQSIFQGAGNDPNYIFFNTVSHPDNTQNLGNYIIAEQLP